VRLPERRRLHAKIAAVLERHALEAEQPPPYEELSYHLAASGDHGRAARFAELAGDRASASSSLDHARQYYRSALDALQKLTQTPELERQWIAVFDKWAAASLYSPSQEHLALIRRAGELSLRLKDLPSAARAEYWLSWFSYALGDLALATKYCRSALARAEAAHDQRLAGQLLLSLGQTLAASGEYGEALAHLAAGLETKRRSYRSKPETLRQERRAPLAFAYALACKGLVHGDLGQFSEAYDCFDEALETLRGTGHAVEGSCLGLLGMVLLLQGRWREALETATRAQATAERVNGPYVFAMSRTVSGYARWMTTRDPEALAELLQAAKWLEGRGIGLFISFNYAYLADALASAGDTRQALDYAARALACAERSDRLGETMAHRTLARIARQEPQRLPEAQMHLDKAMSSARARQSAREVALTNLEAGALHLVRGDKDLAAQSLVAARRIFAQLSMEHHENEASSLLRAGRSIAAQDLGVEGDR
jgi:tetratricopeptide (TPR) repeat protein